MRILVAGATGFLGGHFCEYLKKQGHEVVGFIRNPDKAGLLNKLEVPYELGDLTELDTIIDAMQSGYDVIVNAAGYVDNRGSIEKFRRLNVKTVENIAIAMVETDHSRLVHVSSVAAYGDFGMGITEDYEPQKHKWFKYGLTKLESEEVLNDFDLDITILRPPHIIGERDRTGFVPVLYHTMRRSNTWFEEGKAIAPVTYVKDVCAALELIITDDRSIGETYNVSSDDKIKIYEIIDILHDILGMKIPEKSYSYQRAYIIARISEFLSKFGMKPALTRMGVMFGSKDSSFPADKLKDLGWESTKPAEEMIKEWANWRKEFEEKRKNS